LEAGSYDIVVVGGGHAGIEACLVASRLGGRVLLITHAVAEIGRMPCNPAIGGLGKGHLVREIDILGGEMGCAIDATGIQFRILNRRKGPAVQGPRAQADKHAYQRYMQQVILNQPGLTIKEDDVVSIDVRPEVNGHMTVACVRTGDGGCFPCARVVLSTGTFLRGLMHVGDQRCSGGREGAASSENLSGCLAALGFELRRLKTGTPPRLQRDSVDFGALEAQAGDLEPRPFSFRTRSFAPEQVVCHLAHTNEQVHQLIRANLDRSPHYGGIIEGRGPRYCPSIEDKIVRFADKPRHLLFLEPEGRGSEEIYVNGLATSLPADVQEGIVQAIPGLERAILARYGYAVEYDSVPSYQVRRSLESKIVDGLYLAGQILGTSGYEEAAAQGIIAGINAIMSLNGQQELIIKRSEAYIGVLIDDLVTKDITEPYRMFTSRAEHRLALRCDNAATRLLEPAQRLGLLGAKDLARLQSRVRAVRRIRELLQQFTLREENGGRTVAVELQRGAAGGLHAMLLQGSAGLRLGKAIDPLLSDVGGLWSADPAAAEILDEAENDIRYAGYIAKQDRILKRQNHLEEWSLPATLDYRAVRALSHEAREKLARMRPATLGEASRIDGVRAGDLAVLTVAVRRLQDGRSAAARSSTKGRVEDEGRGS
jgi:tRNA uridine 5-carboxymethylaminomethyl modification enzyme